MNTIGTILNNREDFRTYESDNSLPLNKCLIGIEIELEKVLKAPNKKHLFQGIGWNIVEDHSLSHVGKEFVSIPVFGKDIELMLINLNDLFLKLGITPEITDTCSLHIHVDVRNLNQEELFAFVAYYILFENIFFVCGGINRKYNNFCVPLSQCEELLLFTVQNLLDKTISSEKTEQVFNSVLTEKNRYSSLNLCSIVKHGTIEFRNHKGTLVIKDIMNFIRLCLCLKKQIKGKSINDVEMLPSNLIKKDYIELVQNVFTHGTWEYIKEKYSKNNLSIIDIVKDIKKQIPIVNDFCLLKNIRLSSVSYLKNCSAINKSNSTINEPETISE